MNSLKHDEETLRAILALQANPHWNRVLFWVRESFQREMKGLGGPDNDFRSGMAAQAFDFMDNVHEAAPMLETLLKTPK